MQYLTTENETLCSFAAIIDTSSDTLVASGRLGSISEKIAGVLSDGEIVTFDSDEGALDFYKSDLSFDKKAALPNEAAGYTPAAKTAAACLNKKRC